LLGSIDCRGIPPGTMVRSPHTQRLYRIPFHSTTNAPKPGNI
jgi:hypothetical protein